MLWERTFFHTNTVGSLLPHNPPVVPTALQDLQYESPAHNVPPFSGPRERTFWFLQGPLLPPASWFMRIYLPISDPCTFPRETLSRDFAVYTASIKFPLPGFKASTLGRLNIGGSLSDPLWDWGPSLTTSFNLTYCHKGPFSTYSPTGS